MSSTDESINDGTEFVPCDLEPAEQMAIISTLYECYYDTDQSTKEFAKEFYYCVGNIRSGFVPVRLRYLIEFEDELCEVSPKYKEVMQR